MLPGKGRKPLAWEKLQGKVISPGTAPPYKLSRTITRSICSRSFYKEQGSNAGSTVDGQHISSALHQQNGRDQDPNFGLPSKKSLVMVSQTSDCARSQTYRRRFKYNGRQGVPYLCGQQRLETRTPSVRQSKSGLGPPRGRSICNSSVKTSPPLRQLETESRDQVGQCMGSRLEQFPRLRIFPIFVGGTLPKASANTKCANTSANSPYAEKGMFHSRPPLPRYSRTWDIQKVIDYIKSLSNNESLSLQCLS